MAKIMSHVLSFLYVSIYCPVSGGALVSLEAAWPGLAVYGAIAVVRLVADRRIERQPQRPA